YEGARTWRPSRFLSDLGPGVIHKVVSGVPIGPHPDPPPHIRGPRDIRGSRGVEGGRESPDEEEVSLSFSSISAYRECPRQHWFRYRLRLPAAPGVEAQLGTVLHLALMRAGRLRGQGREVGISLLGE